MAPIGARNQAGASEMEGMSARMVLVVDIEVSIDSDPSLDAKERGGGCSVVPEPPLGEG